MIDRSLNYGRHILDSLAKKYSQLECNPRILDIGAGSGQDLLICRRNLPEADLIAIESCHQNIESLRGLGFIVHSLNVEKDTIPCADESVDLVIANQILEHCKEIFWIFHEATRILKVGGRMYIGVPNLASLHSRILLLFGYQPTCIRTTSAHIRGFTKEDFINFLDTCFAKGYRLTSFRGSNYYPFPPLLAKPLSQLLPRSAACIFFEIQKIKRYGSEFINYPIGLETNFWLGGNYGSGVQQSCPSNLNSRG